MVDTKEELLQYLLTPDDQRGKITPKKEESLMRVISVITLMDNHRLDKDVVDLHLALAERKGKPISRATAYRDLDAAKYIQGDMMKINRKYERAALAQWQKKVMARSLEDDDTRGFNMGMANLIKMLGLDRPDPIDIDYSKVQPTNVVFGFFPELFQDLDMPPEDELEAEIQKLIEPDKFRKKSEYVDFEDIDDGKDAEGTS